MDPYPYRREIFEQETDDGELYFTVYTVPFDASRNLTEADAESLDPLPPLTITLEDYERYQRWAAIRI
jgi:hypothetical protein